MKQQGKKSIKEVIKEKIRKNESLYKEMGIDVEKNETITIESLYTQLQSLKHEIDIELIQKKLKKYDQIFNILADNQDALLEMIDLHKKNKGTNAQ